MKRKPLTNQEFSAFLLVFAIYTVSVCIVRGADAAAGATKPRRNHQKNASSEQSGNPEIFMISETSSRQEILVDVGETVYIRCHSNRTTSNHCEWYKRGPHGGNKKRITQFFGRYERITPCQLKIHSVTYDDEGSIICKAMSDSSEPTFHTNQLTVTGQDDPFGNILSKPSTDKPKTPVVYAEPEIAKESFVEDRLYKSRTGDNFLLKCEATGNPKPLVSWRRGSKNYTLLTEGYSILKLTNLTTDDSGAYKCEAVNIFGRVVNEVTLEVKGELQGASEIIDVTPRNVTLYEGNQGNITCIARFEGDPWFGWVKKIENKTSGIFVFSYEGKDYSVLNRTEIRSLGQHLYATTLLLQNVTVESSGVYHCIVAGLQGYNHSEAYVVVEKNPANHHIAQSGKHKTIAVLWIISFVIFAGLVALCIFRIYGCPNAANNKIINTHGSIPSDSSISRKTQLPKRSPETLSTDCTNTKHEVCVPLVTHGSCSLASQEPSLFFKDCSSSCGTYNSYDPEGSIPRSSGDSFLLAKLEARRSSCSHNAESCDSEFCSQQSVTSPRTQTSDYYTTRQLRVNSYRHHRSPRSHPPQHHHKHRHQHHHHLYQVASENHHHLPHPNHHHQKQQEIHFHPQIQPLNQCSCTQEYCSCHTPSYDYDDEFPRSSSNLYVSSDCESQSQWHSERTKSPHLLHHHQHHHHHPLEGEHLQPYRLEDDGRLSRATNDRKKLNPSPNLSFLEQLKANPNSITVIL